VVLDHVSSVGRVRPESASGDAGRGLGTLLATLGSV